MRRGLAAALAVMLILADGAPAAWAAAREGRLETAPHGPPMSGAHAALLPALASSEIEPRGGLGVEAGAVSGLSPAASAPEAGDLEHDHGQDDGHDHDHDHHHEHGLGQPTIEAAGARAIQSVAGGVLAEFSAKPLSLTAEAGSGSPREAPSAVQPRAPGHDHAAHDHAHQHHHGFAALNSPELIAASQKVLKISGVFMSVELVGGLLAGSLALVADSVHMAVDMTLTAAPLISLWLARTFASRWKAYDHHKTEAVIGLFGAAAISLTAFEIGAQAFERLHAPVTVPGAATIALAFAGLISNSATSWILYRHKDHSLSLKAAFLHFVTDVVSSLGIILAGLMMMAFGWLWLDPVTSFLIVALILYMNWGLVRTSWKALKS